MAFEEEEVIVVSCSFFNSPSLDLKSADGRVEFLLSHAPTDSIDAGDESAIMVREFQVEEE